MPIHLRVFQTTQYSWLTINFYFFFKMIFQVTLAIAGLIIITAVVYYYFYAKKEIKEWVWVGEGKDPFKKYNF